MIVNSRTLLQAVSLACLCGASAAQLVSISPFQSTGSEGFELQGFQDFQPCVQEGGFSGQLSLCTPGANKSFVTGGWIFQCQIGPHSGLKFFGVQAMHGELVFHKPVSRFGAYFATPSAIPGGKARLFDEQDLLLGEVPLSVTADCTWTWNGWQSVSDRRIARVEVFGNHPSGGYILLDDARADFADAAISGSPGSVSLAQGGTQFLTLDGGPELANLPYLVIGTVTGTSPGTNLGTIVLPINSDAYTEFTTEFIGMPPLFGAIGKLDSLGRAQAGFQLNGGLPPVLAGLSTSHTFVVFDADGTQILSASNAAPVTLVP